MAFPPGVTIHNILDESRPRSPILADAFKRAGLGERKGKGVNEMFAQQLRAGRDAPSYARSTTDSFLVSISLGTADLDLVRFLLAFENERQRPPGLEQLRIEHEIKAWGSTTQPKSRRLIDPSSHGAQCGHPACGVGVCRVTRLGTRPTIAPHTADQPFEHGARLARRHLTELLPGLE